MAKFEKPQANEFWELKRQALEESGLDEDAWKKKIIANIAIILKQNPLQYRSFGPYWWLVKSELIKQGITDFGQDVDAEWFEKADYGNSSTNILAAWAYSDNAIDEGLIYSSEHSVTFLNGEFEDEIDVQTYVLVDEEMELQAINATI